jgi:hypothetical protein
MWLVALAGVPMLVLAIDVLYQRRVFGALSSIIFNPNEQQLVEPRDYIWAVVLGLIGVILVTFGLVELITSRPVIAADSRGLRLHLGHPLARAVSIPWDEVDDIGSEEVNDEGSVVPVMWVRTLEPDRLPANPWGARWIETDTIAILASDWELPPGLVAEQVSEVAMSSTSQAAPATGLAEGGAEP